MGQPLVVENNGGAAGRVASALVGRAAPDGQTLLVSAGDGIVISDILYGRSQGILRQRLKPVTMTILAAQLLVTHPRSGIRRVEDYVARARMSEGVTLGVPGYGGIAHLISEYSYIKGERVFLEEDCDAYEFMEHAKGKGWILNVTEKHTNGDSFVRSLQGWRA
jgi:hypothetical protein